MILKAIDPGVHRCAVAYATTENGPAWRLTHAEFESPDDSLPPAVDLVVIERPQIDGRKVNPQVFIDLTASGYLLAGKSGVRSAPVVSYTPRQWKGSLPKPSHHALAIKKLYADELAVLDALYESIRAPRGDADWRKTVEAACKKGARDRWRKQGHEYYPEAFVMHNILDAVALFLHHVGRLVVVKGRRR